MSEINPKKAFLMLMTSLITSQRDVKLGWIQEMDTDSAYMSKSQYMQSYWFSNKSNIKIIYNISVMTITITIIIILGNFGKYAISDCPFIYYCVCRKSLTVANTRLHWRIHFAMRSNHKQVTAFLIIVTYVKYVQRAVILSSLHGR